MGSNKGSKWRGAMKQSDNKADRVVKANLALGGSLQWDSNRVTILDSSGEHVLGEEDTEKEI